MKPRNLAVVKAAAIAHGAPESNGRIVALDAKEQVKLDEIVQSSLNAQANLQKATQDVEQQGGRLVGALEAILDRKGLNPVEHSWVWDGQHVTISKRV